MKIEIKNTDVTTFDGVSQRTGKSFSMRKQTGYVFLLSKAYPVEIQITLERDQQPYPIGFYTLHPDSYTVGRYGDLQIMNLKLQAPLKSAVA